MFTARDSCRQSPSPSVIATALAAGALLSLSSGVQGKPKPKPPGGGGGDEFACVDVGYVEVFRDGKRKINQKFIIGEISAFPNSKLDELFYLTPGK